MLFASLLLVSIAHAQPGDRTSEIQKTPGFAIPPSPALTPAEALKTFKRAPGFHIEMVATEPLVEDPIAMAFDSDGPIWVVETRGFMPDADGKGEHRPVGRIEVGSVNGEEAVDGGQLMRQFVWCLRKCH